MVDESIAHRPFALPGSRLNYGPDKQVDVLHIDLDLTPDLERQSLRGVCTTTVRALDAEMRDLSMDAVDLAVESVERDGKPLAFSVREKKLDITFAPPVAPGEECTFAVRYSVTKPRHGLFFVEPSAEYPGKVRHAWSQSQDQNARFWFPCLDYPHDKQTTSATITVPKGMFALANGALLERREQDGRTIFRYRQDQPHSTYLVTLAAGPFVEREQHGASVPVFYYVLPGREADGERAFGKTPEMIRIFEEKIGTAYPYARYSQIAVTDFIFGGMENTSATTQTDRTLHDERAHLDFSSDPLVSHELAHQWFGDLLTCRDWAHAWLNEGFATYFEAVYRESALGYDEYLYDVFGCVERYLQEDSERYRRAIVCNRFRDPIELFDRHLYEKGGAVLHMLRGELGDARFWRSIRRYVADNAGRNVETIDFIRAIENATGRNMRGFFDQWLFAGGHPQLKVGAAYDSKRKALTVTIDQRQTIDEEHPAYRFDVALRIDDRTLRVVIEREHQTIVVPSDTEPKLVCFDPGAFVLADVSCALGVHYASALLAADSDVVAKIRAARELAKDASSAARAALRDLFGRAEFWGVLAEAAHALGGTHAPWARDLLLSAAAHPHPKVRRAVFGALGNFRDAGVAAALAGPARGDASYFAQSAALHSLGKTRDPSAFEILSGAVRRRTWNGVVEAGAALGLGDLADCRALDLLKSAARPGGDEGLRRAAMTALAAHGEWVHGDRDAVADAIAAHLDDEMFMVARAAIHAAERFGDARLLGALDRVSESAFDGRVRRDAREAAMRLREAQKIPAQVTGLRTDVDALREEQRRIQEKIEALTRT